MTLINSGHLWPLPSLIIAIIQLVEYYTMKSIKQLPFKLEFDSAAPFEITASQEIYTRKETHS